MDMKAYALLKALNIKSGGLAGGAGILVDATLSNSGQAADAKVTGDKFLEINERIDNLVLASGADPIRVIRINNNALPIVDGVVDIPIATEDVCGVVKSSSGENRICVNEDGTMEVASISFDRITQDEDDTIVLAGGGSNF